MEDFIRQYIASQQTQEITFAWQGGEPTLMGLDFFKRVVDLQHKYRRPGTRISNALQTNGVLLDEAWCGFFAANDFLIGISLDGPRRLHDAYRTDKGGRATFDRVMRGLGLLQEHRVEFNTLTAVHAINAGHPLEVYHFLRDEVGARFLQLIPIVELSGDDGRHAGSRTTHRSVSGAQYVRFLTAIFDQWVQRDVGRVFVQLFDVALAAWAGHSAGLCVFAETCGNALAMEHNGDLYACDHFVEPRHRLGNLRETPLSQLVCAAQQRKFGSDKRDSLPRYCRECRVRYYCNGGCPKDRLHRTPDGEPGLNVLCEGYRAFFTHIDHPMRIMAGELAAQRAPANVMPILAQEARTRQRARALAGARRNDPCPCGSGRKFKRCCGAARRA